jgi:ABC-2 type transport system permease protein
MNLRRTRAIARKEFLHILRDWRSLLMALALPLLLVILFGYALSLDVDQIPTVVYDQDRSPESRELIARIAGSRYFRIIASTDSYSTIVKEIDRDACLVGLVISPDYSRDLSSGKVAQVQVILDGSDSNTASIARGYLRGLMAAHSQEYRRQSMTGPAAAASQLSVEPRLRVWYNSDLKSKNFLVPGLIALILMVISAMLTSLTIAREWETGTMEQLLSTPVRPAEAVLGKMSAYFALGAIDTVTAILAGVFVFKVPLRGDLLFLGATCGVFLVGAMCWGILLSAAARTQLLAFQLGLLTTFLPAFLLSGFVFAIENMPVPVQAVTYIFPTRYFITILKGVFLRGVGLHVVWVEFALLTGYAVIVFALATMKLRRKVA